MEIQHLSDEIMLVVLAPEPGISEDLEVVAMTLQERGQCDVIVDFTRVDVIGSSAIGKLLQVRDIVRKQDRELILSSMALATKCIFKVVGLEDVFRFSPDRDTALAFLGRAENPTHHAG